MQNIQVLTGRGGCSKYVCKFIAKIDEQNYVVVIADGSFKLVTKATFLHNTKVTSSKMGEDKDREKHKNKDQGICTSRMEMIHMVLKYPEVVKNLKFIKVSTFPLELRAGIIVYSDKNTEYGAYVISAVEAFQGLIDIDEYRLHTQN